MTVAIEFDESRLETGLWCPHCLLPSGWRMPLLALTLTGVNQFGVIARCGECDRPLEAQ